MKKRKPFVFSKAKLIFLFSLSIFVIISASMTAVFVFFAFVNKMPFLDINKLPSHSGQYVLATISVIIGLILSLGFKKLVLNPLYDIYNAADEIAKGNYDINIRVRGLNAVKDLCIKFNTTAKELNSVETLRSDFINNFSHEFKTPIVSISGFAKILREGNATEEETNEYLDIIISESNRLSELSTSILSLSKLEKQTTLAHRNEFNVSEQIRTAIIMLDNKWNSKNIEIDLDCDDEYKITGDKNLLQQLWTNIIDNAYKYSDEDTEIKITVRKEDDKLIFTCKDSGHGMTNTEVKHVFDKFYQGDLNHKSGGNGLGLSVAKIICDLHHGEIEIKSTGKYGSVFEVRLPLDD